MFAIAYSIAIIGVLNSALSSSAVPTSEHWNMAEVRSLRSVGVLVRFSPTGKVFTGGWVYPDIGGYVDIWDVTGQHPTVSLIPRTAGIVDLSFSLSSHQLASIRSFNSEVSDASEVAEVWDIRRRRRDHAQRLDVSRYVGRAVAISPDGGFVALGLRGAFGGKVLLWHPDSGRSTAARIPGHGVESISISPSGNVVAAGMTAGSVLLFQPSGKRAGLIPSLGKGDIKVLAFRGDGRTLAAGSSAGLIELIPIRKGAVQTHHCHMGEITAIAFSLDGKLLLTGGRDGFVRVWDVATWTCLASRQFREVTHAAFLGSNDEIGIASYGDVHILRLERGSTKLSTDQNLSGYR